MPKTEEIYWPRPANLTLYHIRSHRYISSVSRSRRVLQNLKNCKIQFCNILITNYSLFESIGKNGVLQHPLEHNPHKNSVPSLPNHRLGEALLRLAAPIGGSDCLFPEY